LPNHFLLKGGKMQIIKANIADLWKQNKIVCVTTNGFVKKNYEAVMGRGNALAMAQTVPELPKLLGNFIIKYGNRVGFIYKDLLLHFLSNQQLELTKIFYHMLKQI